jgi:AraC-like DNA-binding protein
MKNSCARPPGPSIVSGVDLLTVWDVDETPTYDVKRETPNPPQLIATRTHAGRGRIELWDGRFFDLTSGTFAVFENERIARYRCTDERWAFWWFEHRISGPIPYPLYELLPCPVEHDEAVIVAQIMTSLRQAHSAHRMHASALFLSLSTGWSLKKQSCAAHPRHHEPVQHTIDEMYHRLGERWSVSAMSKHAGMSERLFRNVFAAVTGQAPKEYYDRLRLDAATELLRLGAHSVKEVAARLGYSSPFHLSRVYRARFGIPPSRARTPDSRSPTPG